jgi:hypothetical protein
MLFRSGMMALAVILAWVSTPLAAESADDLRAYVDRILSNSSRSSTQSRACTKKTRKLSTPVWMKS